jgi:hypothetical protein
MAGVSEKVDDTIIDLSLAIQNVGGADFSNIHLNEVRVASTYLSAAVIDCLTALVDWLNASSIFPVLAGLILVAKKVFMEPDFDEKLKTVHARSGLYSNALQCKVVREKQQNDILEWISPKNDSLIAPKPLDEVADTHRVFINSDEYLDWVGEGPSTLICSGQRTFSLV